MNKTDLVDAVAKSAKLSKVDADRAVKAMVSAISDSLEKGEPVALVGFGTFLTRHRAEREGRNPLTNKPMTIRAAKIAAFRPGKTLKDRLNPQPASSPAPKAASTPRAAKSAGAKKGA